ncbi:polysialyltransferase family glycosyltransferase [Idiomarina sp.]|uniref:polysialyltransferase family glycosyltransferase n=1 Tax=Idiomarina sp. TaxID=1874361 RepID=UPI002ECC05AF|nr:polysialyltransferase family glycosyltransferase [Pseudomonadota bacterium]
MINNLFVVQSPLQALCAVELSLEFDSQSNAVVYRLENGRERNNEQIEYVLNLYPWVEKHKLVDEGKSPLSIHLNRRRALKKLEKRFKNSVTQLFIGEFREQWMHYMRSVTLAERTILIDDGAATIAAKENFLDKGVFFPETLWAGQGTVKNLVRNIIYASLRRNNILMQEIELASAFARDDSVYKVDYSNIRKLFTSAQTAEATAQILFFGSKYSEIGIVSKAYELRFLTAVSAFYKARGLTVTYVAHRDESADKLSLISSQLGFQVVHAEMPAEIFIAERANSIEEIAGAYTSVLNNIKSMFPNLSLRSFKLSSSEIDVKYLSSINKVYKAYESIGIPVENLE